MSPHASSGYGGFIGYNWQWTEAVVALELNYTHGNFFGSNSGSQGRIVPVSGPTHARRPLHLIGIHEGHRLRLVAVRGGYAIDNWLPYGFAGIE